MSGTRIPLNGLRRCIPPSIYSRTFSRTIGAPSARHPTADTRDIATSFSEDRRLEARRRIHGTCYQRDGRAGPWEEKYLGPIPRPDVSSSDASHSHLDLTEATTSEIYDALRELRKHDGNHEATVSLVRHLIDVRGEESGHLIFETLLEVNCNKNGSADTVTQILKDLRAANVPASGSLYSTALLALVVHPDYLTRSNILQDMKDKWIDLTPEGKQSVMLGLLRDGQYELALDKLEELTAETHQGVEVPPWLLDIFVYVFGQLGFHDEALKIVNHRLLKEQDTISLNIWHFLLDSCSTAYHYHGVKYVWSRMVHTRILNPSDAMCINIINTAARHNDVTLASQVMELLSDRGTKLGLHHFEALVDCYAGAGDIENALQAICIMHTAGIEPEAGSTRSIFLSLKQTPSLTEPVLESLFRLRAKYKLPIAAVNVVTEGMLAAGAIDRALDLYRHVRQLCPAGPDAATFNLLLHKADKPHHIIFLGHEMASFNIKPAPSHYDILIRINAASGSFAIAMKFVYDLMDLGAGKTGAELEECPWVARETAEALVRRCFEEEDARVWEITEASRARGMPLDVVVRDVLKDLPGGQAKGEELQPEDAVGESIGAGG